MQANPYADVLGDRDPVEVMSHTPTHLGELLNGLSQEQLENKPAPDKWSLREVMCHLADCEIAWAWRMRVIYEKYHPHLQPFEQDPWARIYKAYTFTQARLTFDSLRMWNLAFIAGLSTEERKRPARHPENGEITLWDVVECAAGHDLHHLAALEYLRQANK